MLGERLIAALVILMLLVGCGSNPTRDDGSPQTGSQSPSTQGTGSSPDTNSDGTSKSSGSSGGSGNFDLPSDPRAALVIVGIVVVLGVAMLVVETIDSFKRHPDVGLTGTVDDDVYHAERDVFSVAVPDEYSVHDHTGVNAHELKDLGEEHVVFLPVVDGEPVYGVSIQSLASAKDATMPLADFATQVNPPPVSSGPTASQKPLPAVLEENITLDGKPALFREYSPGPGADGKHPMYYLLYFVRNDQRSAVLSVTWFKDCPECSTGPEAAVRSMDPHLKQFVESFHLAEAVQAH